MAQQIIINNWQEGIASGQTNGFADMRCVNIHSEPGEVKINREPTSMSIVSANKTFTANAGSDIITMSGADSTNLSSTGIAVVLTTTGTLPAGLSPATTYFVISVTGDTLKLATTYNNAQSSTAIDITDTGTGVHTIQNIFPKLMKYKVNVSGNIYAADEDQRVWKFSVSSTPRLVDGNTRTSGSGNGIGYWKGYVFVFRSASVDVLNPVNDGAGASAWSNSWQAMNSSAGSGNPHYFISGQDDMAYWTDGRYLGSLAEVSGSTFDPASGGTYTFTSQALDFPTDFISNWIQELGQNLYISAYTNSNRTSIFPWDRTSQSFDIPLIPPENKVHCMLTVFNTLYFLAGFRSTLYATNGSGVTTVLKIPDSFLVNVLGDDISFTASDIGWDSYLGKIIFAAYHTSGRSGQSGVSGIYSVDAGTGAFSLEYKSSGGYGTQFVPLTTGFVLPTISAQSCFWSWSTTAPLYGLDNTGFDPNDPVYDDYSAYVTTPLYKVGELVGKETYQRVEVQLSRPFEANAGVRISWRDNKTSAFTQIVEFTGTGTETYLSNDASISSVTDLQLKIEMKGAGTTSDESEAPQIAEVKLI